MLARAAGLATTALLAAAVLVGSGAGSAGAWDQGSAEATLWQLLNGARANNGLNVLVQHGTLVSIARWRSADMVQRNYFSHTILGTGYQVYHWYDINGLSLQPGRREHRLEQRLRRRGLAGGRPQRVHELGGPPREHPAPRLDPRRGGRVRGRRGHVPRIGCAIPAPTPSCS